MSRNRWLVWATLLIGCVLVVWYRSRVYSTATRSSETPRVVFVTGGSGPYWQISVAGAKAAADELDVQLTVEMPATEENAAEQSQILSSLNVDQVQGVAVSPLDAEGQIYLLNRLSEKMPVITFDSDAPLSNRQRYVGTTNYGAGRESAALVREAVPDGGEIAILAASLTKRNNIERKDGFTDALQSDLEGESATPSSYSIVSYLVDDGDTERCARNIRQVLQEHPDVKCFVGMNGHHGPVLVETLQAEGKLGDIKLVVFDAFPETLDGIAAGHIYATLAQDPYEYGFESVRTLKDLIARGHAVTLLGHGTIHFYAQPVRQEDLEAFRQRLEKQRQLLNEEGTGDAAAQQGSEPQQVSS